MEAGSSASEEPWYAELLHGAQSCFRSKVNQRILQIFPVTPRTVPPRGQRKHLFPANCGAALQFPWKAALSKASPRCSGNFDVRHSFGCCWGWVLPEQVADTDRTQQSADMQLALTAQLLHGVQLLPCYTCNSRRALTAALLVKNHTQGNRFTKLLLEARHG